MTLREIKRILYETIETLIPVLIAAISITIIATLVFIISYKICFFLFKLFPL
jgi:hypothetical protein